MVVVIMSGHGTDSDPRPDILGDGPPSKDTLEVEAEGDMNMALLGYPNPASLVPPILPSSFLFLLAATEARYCADGLSLLR
jgi:hypothetical protein